MKILCTVTNDLRHDQRMDRICTALVAAGHEVTLVGRLRPDSRPLPDRPYRQYRIRCRREYGKLFYLEYNYRLWRTLRRWPFDAICAVDLDTLLAGYLLTRGDGQRLVYDAHEWFSETPEVVDRPLVRAIWRSLGRWLVPKTDARYTVAPQLAGELARDYGVAFGTVRNLPLAQDKGPASGAPGIILYQGMFNPGRGLEAAIEAMRWIPEGELWLVGEGPLLGALRRCSERHGVAERVKFLGFRPPAELPALTQQAWLGLNLLENSSPSYYYSLANKALDYVQAGLPSIQMDFPEYRHLNDQYACFRLVSTLSPRELASQINALLRDEDAYRALQENCRRAGRELHWEREIPRLLEIWGRL
ncbi:glycosyltransferase family 4 protein [Lewinella sp. W8]|uniref:glycosyltransferase family 4 protein n=1 Tax=Lewinella sp. W8 TaxID=2528208 RepID=UPI001067F0D3|nr:glycosyltransferase family 4 protein [Lewinella sp. W8]MTB53113.1 glycosyltransferase [Lewinella sp. W8]